MKTEQIVYEPHPVSVERKAELRAKGLKIIDAQFKPTDVAEPDTVPAAAPQEPTEKAPRKPKHAKSEA